MQFFENSPNDFKFSYVKNEVENERKPIWTIFDLRMY